MAIDFKARLNQALQTWLSTVGYAAGLLLRSLQDRADQWWYFLEDPSVPPDRNLAERSLRLAVTNMFFHQVKIFGKLGVCLTTIDLSLNFGDGQS